MRSQGAATALGIAVAVIGIPLSEAAGSESNPGAVPTFECIGLTWQAGANGSKDNECVVRYRAKSAEKWRSGFPLWHDARNGEYRGSLVGLKPGTEYEIELALRNGGDTASLSATTWSEHFPIGKTIELPGHSTETLTLTESGDADGYLLITAGPSGEAVIDVANAAELCVSINASHLILRGLTLRGAAIHGIRLWEKAHDIVIEECEITNWGRIGEEGFGLNPDAAIFSGERESQDIRRVIIQRNRIHHPRADANSWAEYREDRQTFHPGGAQAIHLVNTAGNHVFRYNTIWSDDEHRYNDIIGGGSNYSERGSPNRDSDIYGNHLSHCWDDAIESEGANCNVRIWGNYLDHTMMKIATATTSIGPLYIWRNVAGHARRSNVEGWNESQRGGFLKTSDRMGGGRIFVFHNTLLQPAPPEGVRYPLGCDPGLGHGGNMMNVTTRNNILHVAADHHSSILDRGSDPGGDYDHDLYNGNLGHARQPAEANGIQGKPIYRTNAPDGDFSLAPESPGYDAGQRLPNFNDGFQGEGPDIGAHEAGSPPMEFGVDAYRMGSIGR